MNPRAQKLLAWSGPVFMALFTIGLWGLARCVPPPAPTRSPAEIAEFFREDTVLKRSGLILSMIASAFLAPWTTAIFQQLKRIEGPAAPWAYTQLACGVAGIFVFITPLMILQGAIYRVDTIDPAILYALNDVAWVMLVSTASLVVIQTVAIGAAILQDHTADPVLPRWSGYYTMWTALLLSPAIVLPYFTTGPLAWNGIFSWWIPLIAFGIWIFVFFVLFLKAIDRAEPTERPAADTATRAQPAL